MRRVVSAHGAELEGDGLPACGAEGDGALTGQEVREVGDMVHLPIHLDPGEPGRSPESGGFERHRGGHWSAADLGRRVFRYDTAHGVSYPEPGLLWAYPGGARRRAPCGSSLGQGRAAPAWGLIAASRISGRSLMRGMIPLHIVAPGDGASLLRERNGSMARRSNAGGAATARGEGHHGRLVAWLLTHMLAEAESEPPFGLTSPIDWLVCEAAAEVDDVVVHTRGGGTAYVQAKTSVSLDIKRTDSKGRLKAFPSAIDQFVRLYLSRRASSHGGGAGPLDPASDRLALAPGTAPKDIKEDLTRVLRRLHRQPEIVPLRTAELSQEETRVLEVLLTHVRDSWAAVTGEVPTEEEFRPLLRLMRIDVLDSGKDRELERESKRMLRSSVLADPSQAEEAWEALKSVAQGLIEDRSPIGRIELVMSLQARPIPIRLKAAPRSYQEDVRRLQERSAKVIDRLLEFAGIPVAGSAVRIHRAYADVVRQAAEEGSILITGRPGIGKSGVTYEVITTLRAQGRDMVVIAAENQSATSVEGLREELRLDHDVVEVLQHWQGTEPAFLVIDALDANRDEAVRKTLRELMRAVIEAKGRWRVIASVREYDLRYGIELRDLFQGEPPVGPETPLSGTELSRVRHVTVGELSDRELDQLRELSPALHQVVASAAPSLRELLRNPFNLGIAAELLDTGTEPASIREIRTQMELLDRYWNVRVIGGGDPLQHDARRSVLRRSVAAMMENRTLRVDRHVAGGAAESVALGELLKAHVLVEWQNNPRSRPNDAVLAFSHHMLFDYAIERVYLRGTVPTAVHLARDPQLILLVRPSLEMHFQHLWDEDSTRTMFWRETLEVTADERIRAISKILGPRVAAGHATTAADLEPLLEARERGDQRHRDAADAALTHTLRALLPGAGGARPILGPTAGPWSLVLERVSRVMTRVGAYAVASLLEAVAGMDDAPTPDQRAHLGLTARRLLSFAWNMEPRNGPLIQAALAAVCRYFETDGETSAALVRRSLEKENVIRFGYEELRPVAEAVPLLAPVDPELVRDLYVRAFTTEVTDKSAAPLGGSVVMPLSSSVADQYGGVLYILDREFGVLLRSGPAYAVPAVVRIMRARARGGSRRRSRRRRGTLPVSAETFSFHDRTGRIRQDYSADWDHGSARVDDDATKLLDHLESRLRSLAERPDAQPQLRRWVDAIVRHNDLALIWGRLLRLGSRHPETLGAELKPLLLAPPILGGVDTRRPAREFVKAIAHRMTAAEREAFERVVLSLEEPEVMDPAWRPHIRARLLEALAPIEPATEEGRQLLADLKEADPPADEDPVPSVVNSRPMNRSEHEALTSRGVPVEEPANRGILKLLRPVEELQESLHNVPSTAPVPATALPVLRRLHQKLAASGEAVHAFLRSEAENALYGAAKQLAFLDEVRCTEDIGEFVRELLLEAASHDRPSGPQPQESEEYHASRTPRRLAAEGLLGLGRDQTCAHRR